jgi:hypothetical protein
MFLRIKKLLRTLHNQVVNLKISNQNEHEFDHFNKNIKDQKKI